MKQGIQSRIQQGFLGARISRHLVILAALPTAAIVAFHSVSIDRLGILEYILIQLSSFTLCYLPFYLALYWLWKSPSKPLHSTSLHLGANFIRVIGLTILAFSFQICCSEKAPDAIILYACTIGIFLIFQLAFLSIFSNHV